MQTKNYAKCLAALIVFLAGCGDLQSFSGKSRDQGQKSQAAKETRATATEADFEDSSVDRGTAGSASGAGSSASKGVSAKSGSMPPPAPGESAPADGATTEVAGDATGDAASEAPKIDDPAPGDGGQGTVSMLTAGRYDDALNLEKFFAFWRGTTAEQQATALATPPSGLPSMEGFQPPARFDQGPAAALDIAFVVDVTGSMGDELLYVRSELEGLIARLGTQFPGVPIRVGSVVYRDVGDEFVTRTADLGGEIAPLRDFLGAQSAGGGGDYPEAMDAAFVAASEMSWSTAPGAKVAFVIADAPPHAGRVAAALTGIDALKAKGVHVYPVAASGTDDLAERIMRYAALVTGGEYLFLTDDSGVGNAHTEPHISCYAVRKWNQTMIDVLTQEISGTRFESGADSVLRQVGTSENGVCR